MNFTPQSLAALLHGSSDAVLGINDNRIVFFANPVAKSLLGLSEGMDAISVFPENVFSFSSESYAGEICSGSIQGSINALRQGDFTLICYTPIVQLANPRYDFLHQKVLDELGSTLLSTRLSIDALVSGANLQNDEKLYSYATTLYRNYYRMKRLHDHIYIVHDFEAGSLPFVPQIVNLDRLCGDICSTVSYVSQSKNIKITYQAADDNYYTKVDRSLFEIALLNLLEELISKTEKDSSIEFSLTRQGKRYLISISASNCETDTEKNGFASHPGSENVAVPRDIMLLHSGSLITENHNSGIRFHITLPVTPPDKITVNAPPLTYHNAGMDVVLTEFSPILDKSYYCETMFD